MSIVFNITKEKDITKHTKKLSKRTMINTGRILKQTKNNSNNNKKKKNKVKINM